MSKAKLLIFIFLLCSLFSWSQTTGRIMPEHGFKATGIFDTIPAILLITIDTASSEVASVNGFVIREKHAFWGDAMSLSFYDPYWVVVGYLSNQKKIFLKSRIVWNHRIVE